MSKKPKTRAEHLVDFVLDRFNFSRTSLAHQYTKWREFYNDYRATRAKNKQPWQANYVVPVLRDIVRTKVPLYMNILFPIGLKSFDVEVYDSEDYEAAEALKAIIMYQLRNVARQRGGFFACVEKFLKNFEIYGYAVVKVPWRLGEDYEGPDIEVVSLFDFFPDPASVSPLESWVIVRRRDVTVAHLKALERQGIYSNLSALSETSQPADVLGFYTTPQAKDRVELLEFHGDVPAELLEGKITDEIEVDPYRSEYVRAIITVANQKVCIRAVEYPYEAASIFVDAAKDVLCEEPFGFGTAEDVQAMSEELVNAHNKLTDCINIIANPMFAVNPAKVAGVSEHLIACPGRVFKVNAGVENVLSAISPIPTTAQVGALNPIITLISMLEEKIMKISQSVPAIAPMPSRQGMHQTLGGTLLMQGNAIEPIKHVVRHCLEPWFERVLEVFYVHNLQFFDKELAVKVFDRELAERWVEEKQRKDVRKSDITFKVRPRFVPRGVSIFSERQSEVQALLNFLQVAGNLSVPAVDALGQPVVLPDGTPVAEPLVDAREIVRRLAFALGIEDIDRLVPSLRREKELRAMQSRIERALRGENLGRAS